MCSTFMRLILEKTVEPFYRLGFRIMCHLWPNKRKLLWRRHCNKKHAQIHDACHFLCF